VGSLFAGLAVLSGWFARDGVADGVEDGTGDDAAERERRAAGDEAADDDEGGGEGVDAGDSCERVDDGLYLRDEPERGATAHTGCFERWYLSVALKFRWAVGAGMSEDESNRTLLDFEPSSDDEATDEGVTGDDGGEREAGDADGDPEAGDDGSETVVRDVASVPSAVSTSRFAPDGESCASCEASTRRLWMVEGDAVCGDCKSW